MSKKRVRLADDWKEHRPYNPLSKKNLGDSVAAELLRQPVHHLPPAEPFKGSGLYAIYYVGPFLAYGLLRDHNRDGRWRWPIYVGKADLEGRRKGEAGLIRDENPDPSAVRDLIDEEAAGRRGVTLYKRLKDHARSIEAAENLHVEHFYCRYLVVDPIWIPLGEALLITKFRPLWNVVVEGFGNHDPGSGRHAGERPKWDMLHPGRPWAPKLRPNAMSTEDISRLAETHLATPPDAVVSSAPDIAGGNLPFTQEQPNSFLE